MKLQTIILCLIAGLLAACNAAPAATPTATPTATPQPTATPAPTATPTPLPYAAIPGVYLGTFHGVSTPSTDLFAELGKGIAISAVYLNWPTPFNAGMYRANARVGRITLATLEYKPKSSGEMTAYEGRVLEAIVDGMFDATILDWAEGVKEFEKPILLRWGHEMNGDWYPWGGAKNGGGTLDGFGDPAAPDGPERFVAAYRHIYDIFAATGADNALFVWCPNAPFEAMDRLYGSGPGGWNRAEAYYPGDEYVDWLCFDGYNWGASPAGQAFNSTWTSFAGIFDASYQRLHALNPGAPILIGEFASTEDGGAKAAWITDAYTSIQRDYPQIRGVVWFHINKETDWRIDSSPEAFTAYQQAISSAYWLDAWPGMK